MDNILIIIPTFNENKNINILIENIFNKSLEFIILIIDDSSTDGTLETIKNLQKTHKNLFLLQRPKKMGIGSAHIDGIKWAYKNNYLKVITMDGDLTHSTDKINEFIEQGKNFDLVVGSRFLDKNSLNDWNFHRKLLTYFGHFCTKFFLKIDIDATGGFRFYNLNKIPFLLFDKIESKNYSFFIESIFIIQTNYFSITEVPLTLPKRTYGTSKMRISDLFQSLNLLISLFFLRLFNIKKFFIHKNFGINRSLTSNQQCLDWNDYWFKKKRMVNIFYDTLAFFYRSYIIKPALNFFVKKYSIKNTRILHAGCGSGKVDEDLLIGNHFTAIDISTGALTKYSTNHGYNVQLLHADIFKIPFNDNSFDIIFNLGVMEHFNLKDIKLILDEFKRVLKIRGKIILFWPPKKGPTVIFLKYLHLLLNFFSKNKVKLHPDEITYIESEAQARNIISDSGLSLIEYYRGIKDLYTHAILVLQK